MSSIQDIYEAIAAEGFCERVLQLIDEQVNDIQNGTRDFPRYNLSEQGVNYISDRMALEDMHPANVFIDEVSGCPICIDCIVKFI